MHGFSAFPNNVIKSDRVLIHHPKGDGECFNPIFPFNFTQTHFVKPTIEETLFGEFSKNKHHKKISSFIFNKSIEYTRKSLLEWFHHPDFDLKVILNICKSRFIEIDDYLASDEKPLIAELCKRYPKREYNLALNPNGGNTEYNPPVWSSYINFDTNYLYWATIWIRINCTMALMEYMDNLHHEKALLFINSHIHIARYLDSLPDPSDEHINISALYYESLGESNFDSDRNLIKITVDKIRVRKYPLEILEVHYPNYKWRIETVRPNVKLIKEEGYWVGFGASGPESHNGTDPLGFGGASGPSESLLASLTIMVQCKILHKTEENMEIRDALWFYHLCFMDYVFNYPNTENLYPYDNRCFTAYDLPDVLHVITLIPLWNKNNSPEFELGKFIQKSLPFAGARRTLINQTVENMEKDPIFWKLFSSLFYCLLMDTYPEHISKNRNRCFDLKRLLDIMRFVTNKNVLKESLARTNFKDVIVNFNKENDKGCFIVFTVVRMWVVMNLHNQRHYIEGVKSCMDFDLFESQVCEMAKKIRESDFTAEDVFSEAREYLNKNTKNSSKTVIYRYRKGSVASTLSEQMSKKLKDFDISIDVKQNILNHVIRMKKDEWLSPLSLSIMRDLKFGGVSQFTIMAILKLVDIYYKSSKPKDIENCLKIFDNTEDFKVVTWYFHVLNTIDNIDFDPLTIYMIEKIDDALMNVKFVLCPGQYLPLSVFDVFFTICCKKLKTLTGVNEYGNEGIAYDVNTKTYQCAKTHKKLVENYKNIEYVFEQKKENKKKQKVFNLLPCKNNPVLSISIRGFMMIYDGKRFLHCPECGTFHKFEWTGYKGSEYKCEDCRSKEKLHITCRTCYEPATETKIVYEPLSQNGVFDVFQRVYYCKKHLG